ncbi:MAG: peptide-methionine (S)-S-oxide reductase [Acidocella sp. 20-57-95]|nr:MAG: peptide-methionine (S)-S-oxide reductase [Acidocella sp. 20-57-95]OYV61106.1 MAG: peptide-methionine (S)-S-oxide reductase [Acidocella sp. 21-58-7]HQT65215.1 peptide-methionine (S)-S-oxide reductase MsrA [Acidocella sp.]HQU04506.1 peptide-methionine (S)-S-oxide reductase MsrA [Acidocella sp.]
MKTEIATLGGGCFWCLEAAYSELAGILTVQSGYAGGHVEHPSYKQVCSGATGHAEVVQITFDPSIISYDDLLKVFFTIHDPTTLNRQGADVGTQYRSVIFTHSPAQAQSAQAAIAEFASLWPGKIVTQVQPAPVFYQAEPEHDNYYARNPYAGYCQAVVAPKVAKVRAKFFSQLRANAI